MLQRAELESKGSLFTETDLFKSCNNEDLNMWL